MKQYTTPEQTAKLIKLGFEKPQGISGYYQRGPYEYDTETNTKMVVYDDTQYPIYAYSIGELIEFVNQIGDNELRIFRDDKVWSITTDFNSEANKELIDAIYCMLIRLKEEEVI